MDGEVTREQSCEVQKGVGSLGGDTTGKAGLGHLLPDLDPKELQGLLYKGLALTSVALREIS